MNAQQVPQCKQRRVTYLLTYIFEKKKKKRSNIRSCPQVPVLWFNEQDVLVIRQFELDTGCWSRNFIYVNIFNYILNINIMMKTCMVK